MPHSVGIRALLSVGCVLALCASAALDEDKVACAPPRFVSSPSPATLNLTSALFEVEHVQEAEDEVWPQLPKTFADFTNETLVVGGLAHRDGTRLYNASTQVLFSTVGFTIWSTGHPDGRNLVPAAVCAVRALSNNTSFKAKYRITAVSYGFSPVAVPTYMRRPVVHNDTVFTVMGAIGALLMLMQGVYGAWYVCQTRGTLRKLDVENGGGDDADR